MAKNTRRELREKAMICVYQHLLTRKDLNEIMEDIYLCKKKEMDPFAVLLVEHSIANEQRFAGYIDEVIEDWSYDRLGYIEKAILLLGCTEFDNKTNDMSVIINECVEMAKKYCDENAYRLINSVLEKL